MSVAHDLRLFRIRTLQRSYRAQQSDLPLLEERIGLLEDVLAHYRLPGELGPDPIALAERHYDMGCALYERFMHLRTDRDLEHAENHLRLALLDLTAGAELFPGPQSMLGTVLQEHAYIVEDSDMAQEAVRTHHSLWSSVQTAALLLERAYRSRELGRSLRTYCHLMNDVGELLSHSIECLEQSQTLYLEAGLTNHMCAFGLCLAYSSLFLAKTSRSDLDQAIAYGTASLQLCGPHHRDVYAVISQLEYLQCEHCGDLDTQIVDETITTLRDALAGAPSERAPPGWTVLLTQRLAHALDLRATQKGSPEDLTEATTRIRAVLTTVAPTNLVWSRLQSSLSLHLIRCFELTGAPRDIEAAASAADLAVVHSIPGSKNHLYWLHTLAVCRVTHYTAFGDITHLDECIALLEEIVRSSATQSTVWNTATLNLAEVLQLRYEATRSIADLDQAMEMVPLVLASVNNQGRNKPDFLHHAGTAFLSRFEVTGATADLDQAMSLLQRAVLEDSTTEDHMSHHRAGAFVKALCAASEVLHDGKAAAKALQLQQQIVTSLPDTHPDRARALCGLARLQLSPKTNSDAVAQALAALLCALSNRQCPAYRRLKDVYDVLLYLANHPLEHEHAGQVSVVYSAAIALLPEVASFGLNPSARLAVMISAGPLTTSGATHAISSGHLDVALEMLEAGRSVFWAQNLQLRTPFTNLPEAMAESLTRTAYALARPMPEGLNISKRDRELARRRQLGEEFRSVVDEARRIPGFEGLLRNVSFASIAQAATHHPIVVFIADENSGNAIIIQNEMDSRLVTLPNMSITTLQKLSHRLERHSKNACSSRGIRKVHVESERSDDVYRELWTLVMHPVVETLLWPRSEGRERRRLTLCPTGAFMQLPLHAAGIYSGNDQVSCADYFVRSYTPSIAALLHAQQSAKPVRRAEADTLLVAIDLPVEGAPLPMASKEASTVRLLVSPLAKVVQIASCDAVLDHIQSATIVHLACHGTQNPANALESSFHLEDGLLPVSKLMELELPSAFLAVLSACETAKGDTAQPDQAIHLAAAMLFAGFKSVVATMWFMGDAEGPDVAKGIYSALFKQDATSEYLDPDDVPYALDEVVQKLRRSGLDPSFWATYVHIGI